jgi:RNA recognition motif-containing protein
MVITLDSDYMDTEIVEDPTLTKQNNSTTTVFIGGVPSNFSETQLKQLCSEFGTVIDCHLSVCNFIVMPTIAGGSSD